MKYRKGVFAVVYALGKKPKSKEKPRYLLLHRKLHWRGWEFPKGGKLANEKITNNILREIREETGLKAKKETIRKYPIKGKFDYDAITKKERKFKGFVWQLYSCEVEKAKVRVACEHDGFGWYYFKKALNLLGWKNQKKCLMIVDKSLKK